MKPSEFKKQIADRFKNDVKRPVLVEASPGVGKTQLCAQVAAELGIGFKAIHAPLLQPEDYGFPVVSTDRKDVDFLVSKKKFPLVGSDCPESGILLIDELPQANDAIQKILANLVQEREIHGQYLKEKWLVVATGNRVSDRSGAFRVLGHLRQRTTKIDLEVSLDDWTQWALDKGIKPEVIGFIRFRPELLNAFNPQLEVSPTPRAWSEGVSATLGVIDSTQEFEVFKGDVGEGAASEFMGFLKLYRKLPSPDMILLNPTKIDVPTESSVLYALCGALSRKTTKDNFGRMMQYVSRMPEEFSVLYIRDSIRLCPDIQATKEFIAWASGPGAKLLS